MYSTRSVFFNFSCNFYKENVLYNTDKCRRKKWFEKYYDAESSNLFIQYFKAKNNSQFPFRIHPRNL